MTASWLATLGVDEDDPAQRRRVHEAERLRAAGRVMSVRAVAGRIDGRVQGAHARPHLVELAAAVWDDERWSVVEDRLGRHARYYAQLLAGVLPTRVDDALRAVGLQLIPEPSEWRLGCTCPERRPCAHQIAVWLTVRDRLDDDPYVMTRVRGRSREQLLAQMRDRRADDTADSVALDTLDVDAWSRTAASPEDVPLPPARPVTADAGVLRMLGDPPRWAGPASVADTFTPAITAAAARARELLDDDPPDAAPPSPTNDGG